MYMWRFIGRYSVFFSEFEWSFSQDLSAILVKQEEPDVGQRLDPQPLEGPPLILSPAPPHRGSTWKHTVSIHPHIAKHCILCYYYYFLFTVQLGSEVHQHYYFCVFIMSAGAQSRWYETSVYKRWTQRDWTVSQPAQWYLLHRQIHKHMLQCHKVHFSKSGHYRKWQRSNQSLQSFQENMIKARQCLKVNQSPIFSN